MPPGCVARQSHRGTDRERPVARTGTHDGQTAIQNQVWLRHTTKYCGKVRTRLRHMIGTPPLCRFEAECSPVTTQEIVDSSWAIQIWKETIGNGALVIRRFSSSLNPIDPADAG